MGLWAVLYEALIFDYAFSITPQAIFSPEFPEGWVVKSSGEEWIIMVRPKISSGVTRAVKTEPKAKPLLEKRGGRSPLW